MGLYKVQETGAGAIALTATVPNSESYRLVSVTLKLSAAAAAAGTYSITLDAVEGATYDPLLYSVDPSVSALTNIIYYPDAPLLLEGGDKVTVAYTNPDGRTYGTQITMETKY